MDGYEYTSDEEIELAKNKKHDISAVVDRLVVKEGIRSRLAESLELAFELSEGLVVVKLLQEGGEEQDLLFSRDFACPDCGFSLPELSPRMFSFNSPFGACPECGGLGEKREFDPALVLDHGTHPGGRGYNPVVYQFPQLFPPDPAGDERKIPNPHGPAAQQPGAPQQIKIILYGNQGEQFKINYTNSYGETGSFYTRFEGVINTLKRRYQETKSDLAREEMEKVYDHQPLPGLRRPAPAS